LSTVFSLTKIRDLINIELSLEVKNTSLGIKNVYGDTNNWYLYKQFSQRQQFLLSRDNVLARKGVILHEKNVSNQNFLAQAAVGRCLFA
ncbi:MAG TPA: hypothetical protein DEV81_25030, partial [Cyanobacteria bacterium UBA11049]|nr:hypothetical protein [Cyanobacteria bacterium UBA11049]